MTDRRRFEHDSAARQRTTGELSTRQTLVLVAITAFVSASGSVFLGMGILPSVLVMMIAMLLLFLAAAAVLRRYNVRRRG